MMNTCVWYSVTASGSQDSATKARSDQAMRRASGAIPLSGAQERVAHDGAELIGEVAARSLAPDVAALHHVEVGGYLDRLVDVLVHEQDGHALLSHRQELRIDLLDDARREPRGGLVHEE